MIQKLTDMLKHRNTNYELSDKKIEKLTIPDGLN